MENKNLNIAKRFVEFLSNKLNPKANQFAGIKGKLTLKIFKDGELIETMVDNNLIVNAGQSWVMDLLKNTPLSLKMNPFIMDILQKKSHFSPGPGSRPPGFPALGPREPAPLDPRDL